MSLSERKKQILTAVINNYIETAEPVGSKALAQKAGLSLSPATIRNELSELTTMGYLEQPHTSAGRIPSPSGYRLFVNELMHQHKLSLTETERINAELNSRLKQLDRLIADVSMLASQLTAYPALALAPPVRVTITRFDLIYIDQHSFIIVAMLSNQAVKNKLIHLPVSIQQEMVQKLSTLFNAHFTNVLEENISEHTVKAVERASGDTMGIAAAIASFAIEILTEAGVGEAYVAGTSHLLQHPEFRDPDKAHRLLNYLSDSERLLALAPSGSDGEVKVMIGPENIAEELQDSSVIMASYDAGDNMKCLVGVVGPTRMDYAKVAARLKYFAMGLSRLFRGEAPPGKEMSALLSGEDTEKRQLKGDGITDEKQRE